MFSNISSNTSSGGCCPNKEWGMVSEGMQKGIEGHWFNAVPSHLKVESDGGNQPVLMSMGGVLLFPIETRMQIWECVDASVLLAL